MTCTANPQHLKLINRLKKIEEYKDDSISLQIDTWSYHGGQIETEVLLWSRKKGHLYKGSSMTELERFINSERKKAGVFQEKTRRR